MQVNDLVKGLPGTGDPVVNEHLITGQVVGRNCQFVRVRVLSHDREAAIGREKVVPSQWLEVIEHPKLKPFDRRELELTPKRDRNNWLQAHELIGANLREFDLSGVTLIDVDLSHACLNHANLHGAILTDANLSHASLFGADLSRADLSGANLFDAELRQANLSYTILSRVAGLTCASQFMNDHFERIPEGYIVYKTFGTTYTPNPSWKIEIGSVLTETVNPNRQDMCGCGINVAPLEWVTARINLSSCPIYRLLIRNEWLPGVVVPFNTSGQIRCEKAEIIGVVEND